MTSLVRMAYAIFLRSQGLNVLRLRRVLSHFSANLVLEDTVERIYHQDVFAEQWVGLFLIRGENVVLLGEIVSTQNTFHHLRCAYAWRSQSFVNLIALSRLLGS